jgi:tetratricopeptide (TPR) repeat protein
MKTTIALLMLMALGLAQPAPAQEKTPAAAAQDKKKEWKDRAEYDLFESITKTQDPNQWLAALDKWKQQYPQTDYADIRRKLYLAAYRQLNKPRQAFDAAQEVLKDNPNDLVALSAILQFIYPLVPPNTPQLTEPQTADLGVAEKAASTVLNNLDAVYSKDNRPPDMTDDQANKARPELKTFAQKTVGYIALVRKDNEKAVTELTKALQLDPNQAQVSFWLGTATLAQNKAHPELQPLALYDFARAAAYSGPGSLPASDRKQISDYLGKVYAQYHGSAEGLDKLMAQAQSVALPPAGFSIKTKADFDREKAEAEDAAAKANPMLALWRNIKKELQSDNGQGYFDANMKGAELPGGVNGVTQFRGKLVSATPEMRPKTLVLAMEDPSKPDVTLKLDSPLPGKMEAGGEIRFSGVADSFAKDPLMVTFTVEKSKIEGWTGKNAPVHRKKTGGF